MEDRDPVLREIEHLRAEMGADRAEIKAAMLPREVYELRHQVLAARVQALEEARVADLARAAAEKAAADQQRRSDRRWVVGAVIIPIVVTVLTYILSLRGAA